MKHIKDTETLGKELGYSSIDLRYAAVVGCLSAKIECIANELERLWSRPGLEKEDLVRTLLWIEHTIKDVIED